MDMLLNKSNSEQVRHIFRKNEETYCVAMNLHTMENYIVNIENDKIKLSSKDTDIFVDDEDFNVNYKIREIEY